jgi:hypothetical protein
VIAAIAIAALVAVTSFAIYAIAAERRAGAATARADVADKSVEVAAANLDAMTKDRDAQKERGDALDQALADAAATGPTDGAFDRLLSRWQATRAAAGGDAAQAVRNAGASGSETSSAGPDGLLRPGE